MKLKKIVTIILVSFVVVSIAYLIYKELGNRSRIKRSSGQATQSPDTVTTQQSASANKDTVRAVVTAPADSPNPGEKTEKKPTPNSEVSQAEPKPKSPDTQIPPVAKSKVVAYYFYTDYRCPTCLKIEKFSKEAIEQYFSKELQQGKLTFKSVNIDDPENAHYIQDYQLSFKSLVVASYVGGKQTAWKNLTLVWEYVGDRDKFFQYLKDETAKFLSETN